jgi:hypothetical protein
LKQRASLGTAISNIDDLINFANIIATDRTIESIIIIAASRTIDFFEIVTTIAR